MSQGSTSFDSIKPALFLAAFVIFFPAVIVWWPLNAVSMGLFVIVFGEPLDLNTRRGQIGAKLLLPALYGPAAVGVAIALAEAYLLISKFFS